MCRIVVWEADDVLTVPSSALFRSDESWNVFVVERGKARLRPITIGHQNNEETQILDGLSEGEIVILHPTNNLVEGKRVESR